MGLCIATYSKPIKYVPDVLGNRKLESPFWVLIEPCSGAEYEAMGASDLDVKVMLSIVKSRVKQVSGLEFDLDDGRKWVPVTGEALVAALTEAKVDNPTRNAIANDLAIAVLNHSRLKEGELDRFVSQSA